MYKLCKDCFKNKWLKRYVEEKGGCGQCSRCKSIGTVTDVSDKRFQNLLKAVFRYYYSETLYNSHWGGADSWLNLLTNTNEIFNFTLSEMICMSDGTEKEDDLYYALDEIPGCVRNFDEEVSLYYGGERMEAFMQPIREEIWWWLRDIDKMLEIDNPHTIAGTIRDKIKELIKPLEEKISDLTLFRARIGIETVLTKGAILSEDRHEVTIPYKGEKIASPPPSVAAEGRFNRKGTSYLYLASSKETAISEVRPSVGHDISIGCFMINSQIQVIDFTKLDFYEYAFSDNKISQYIKLNNLEMRISIPNPDKNYSFTQCFADALLELGYDGIKFRSSLTESAYNLVLFQRRGATYIEGSHEAVHIQGVKYDFCESNTVLNTEYLEDYLDMQNVGKERETILEHFGIDIWREGTGNGEFYSNDKDRPIP